MIHPFLQQLRAETSEWHTALEQNGYAKALMHEAVTIDDYAGYLERMYGFVSVFEELVLPSVSRVFAGIQPKAPLIEADLLQLGRDPLSVVRIDAKRLSSLYSSTPAAYGTLYVMEGSTLGGMVIVQHLSDCLGNAIAGKTSYFTVYGQHTGSHWKQFIEKLVVLAATEEATGSIIKGAVDTFRLLNEWMHEQVTESITS